MTTQKTERGVGHRPPAISQQARFFEARASLIQFAAGHGLDRLLKKALDEICGMVGSPIGFYHFVEPDQETISLQQWSSRTLEEFCTSEGSGLHYNISRAGVWADCIRTGQPAIHNDYAAMADKRGMPQGHAEVVRELVVPVIREEKVVAVLGVGNKLSDYTDDDADFVSCFADVTWEIVRQKRAEEALALQKDIESELSRLSAMMLATTDLEEVAYQVLETAKRLTKAQYGYVGSIDRETGHLVCHTMTRDIWDECRIPDKSIVFEGRKGLWGWVLDHKEPVMLNDLGGDPRSSGVPKGHIGIRAYLGVPALIGDTLVGQISLANPLNRFLDIDLTIAQRLATLFALAIQRHDYEKSLVTAETRKAEELEQMVEMRTAELERSKLLLEKVFTSQMDAILILDSGIPPRIIDCNPAALALFSYTREDMVGQNTLFLHRDEASWDSFRKQLFREVEKTGRFHLKDFPMKRNDGSLISTEIGVAPLLNEEGEQAGWISVIHDISEQKAYERTIRENEEKFRAIADYTYDWETWMGPDGLLRWVNPAVERITGYSSQEYMEEMRIEQRVKKFVAEPDREKVARLLREGVEQQKSVNDRHVRILRKDGSQRWVSLSYQPIFSEDGAYLGLRTSVRDITERKQAIDAVRQSEARFKAFMDNLPAAAFITDRDGRTLFYNDYTAQMLGAEPTWIGRTPDQVFPGPAARKMARDTEEVLAEGVRVAEETMVRTDGSELHYQSVKFAFGPSREDSLVGSIAWDVTEQKNSRKRLMESESRFRQMFDNMSSGVAIYESPDNGQTFIFKDLNRTGQKSSNCTRADILGRDVAEVFPGIKHMGLLDVFKRVWQTGSPEHHPQTLYRDDRIQQWVDNYVFKLPSSELVAVYDDVSAQKIAEAQLAASEERLKLALDSVSDAVWDWRADTGEVIFSSRWYTMLGYEPYELPQSYDTWQGLLHPDDAKTTEQTILSHLESGEPFEVEFRMRTKDNKWRWILGRGKTVDRDDQGRPRRMLGTHLDLTERKQMEARLRQTQKMEAIGTLAGGIAHDFNNTLAAIIGYTELVLESIPEETKAVQRLRGVLQAGERARDLISQILTFSRKKEKEFQPLDIRLVIKEALGLIRASLPSTIRIDRNIPVDLPYIMGDPTQIHQVIMNLSTNAAQAMEQHGTLCVSIKAADLDRAFCSRLPDLKPGPHVCLSVSDTGCGIQKEILPNIFDPFFTTKSKGGGTGLGLSVVHGIVKEHDGEVLVDSSPGAGARFDLYFPAIDPIHRAEEQEGGNLPSGRERVLVVDDEEVLSIIVAEMLENQGYEVTSLNASQEALELFTQNPNNFDILLSDITMPKLTGTQLTRECRKIRPDLPVILWSGNETPMSKQPDDDLDAVHFLRKPFRQKDLARALREVLDKKS